MHSSLLFLSLKCLESASKEQSAPFAQLLQELAKHRIILQKQSKSLPVSKRFPKSVLSWLQLLHTPDRYLVSIFSSYKPMSSPPVLTNKSSHNLVGTHRTDHTADLRVLLRLQVNSLALVVPAKREKKFKKLPQSEGNA